MNEEQDRLLTELTGQLTAAHAGRLPLAGTTIKSGRALLRAAWAREAELTEEDHDRLEKLFGLVRWGELVYPLLRMDPWVFAEALRSSRRARRLARGWQEVTPPEWRD